MQKLTQQTNMACHAIRHIWRVGVLLALLTVAVASTAQTNAPLSMLATGASSSGPKLSRIGSADVLEVVVYQEEDLKAKVTVDAKGMVSLPLLGSVQVGGSTTDEAAATIRDLYGKDYLVNPQVTVSVAERAKRRFTVMGQVNRPGVFEFPPEESVNLLQALATAGGYTRLASPSKVTLQRMENGLPRAIRLDAQAMSRDPNAAPFQVLPDDVINVGERLF